MQEQPRKIIIVGSPNVGKSAIFNNLTKSYANVSNYPGTTVEVFRGRGKIGGENFEIIDTPGMYSLIPLSEEEQVSRNILLNEPAALVLHVIDAKNLERMLPLTLQLIEAGLRVILTLNVIDEADKLGFKIDLVKLSQELGIPVVATAATQGRGMDILKGQMEQYVRTK